MKHVILFSGLLLTAASCHKLESADGTLSESPLTPTQVALPQPDVFADGKTQLIKTINYRFEVKNVKQSTEAIEAAVRKYPAYISASSLVLQNPVLENKITIRVQSAYFADLLKEIDQQAVFVNFRDLKTEDVAKQFVDLESRLRTKRALEARYEEILRKKTGDVKDLFTAEAEISALHEDIEATVSRTNFLRDQVQYSTVNLELYQTISQNITAGDAESVGSRFSNALRTGWLAIVTVAVGITYAWPALLLAAVFVAITRYARKRKWNVGTQSRPSL